MLSQPGKKDALQCYKIQKCLILKKSGCTILKELAKADVLNVGHWQGDPFKVLPKSMRVLYYPQKISCSNTGAVDIINC